MTIPPDLIPHVRIISRAEQVRRRERHSIAPRGLTSNFAEPNLSTEAAELANEVLSVAGLHLHAYRTKPIQRRIPALLRAIHASSIAQAKILVKRNPQLAVKALNTLLIGHTDGFRDTEVFEYLEFVAIPELRQQFGPLNVWSLGCSSGEELLSVALLLAAHREAQQTFLGDSFLRGSDCRPEPIAIARKRAASFFVDHQSRSVSTAQVRRGDFIDICNTIDWQVQNILTCKSDRVWHLVLCRNVSIYLQNSLANLVWQKIYDTLAVGGLLVTGKAERIQLPGLLRVAKCVYQKIGLSTRN